MASARWQKRGRSAQPVLGLQDPGAGRFSLPVLVAVRRRCGAGRTDGGSLAGGQCTFLGGTGSPEHVLY